jgi:hypothetical protein
VDLAVLQGEPRVYVFPAAVVAEGLRYYFSGKFPNSDSYHLSLDFRPQGRTKENGVKTVGEFIDAERYVDAYATLGIDPVVA